MSENNHSKKILQAIEKVEHPSIATSLQDLGMLRGIEINDDGNTVLTLVLPFPNIPENIRSYMVNSLAMAVQAEGGKLEKVNSAIMNERERQMFLMKEQQNWRG